MSTKGTNVCVCVGGEGWPQAPFYFLAHPLSGISTVHRSFHVDQHANNISIHLIKNSPY